MTIANGAIISAADILSIQATANGAQPAATLSSGTVTATGSTTARTLAARAADTFNARDYGVVADGTTDDTTAWRAVVAAAIAAGGGTIVGPSWATTVISGTITINASNVQIYFPDTKVKLTGSASFNAFYFTGSYAAAPTFGVVNPAQFDLTVTLASLGGLTAGGWLMMQRDAPWQGSNYPSTTYAPDVYTFIGKARAISGSGPYVVTLVDPLPCSFGPSGTYPTGTYHDWDVPGQPLRLNCMSPLDNVGISGTVMFDGSAATGTTVHGVYVNACVNSRFSGISGRDMAAGALLYASQGFNNSFSDLFGERCGTSSYDTFGFIGQNQSQMHRIRIYNADGFGFGLESSNYCTVSDVISSGAVGRGIKLGACLHNTLTNLEAHASTGKNGIAVSIGSCLNTFFGLHGYSNEHYEGIWLSDQNNCDNLFFGAVCYGNSYDIIGHGNRDLHIGALDLRNAFFGAKIAVIETHNDTTLFFGLNGGLISGTNYASNVNTVTSLLTTPSTGVLAGLTAAVNTNSTQVATTAFVVGQAGTATPVVDGAAAVGTSLLYARQDHVHPTPTVTHSNISDWSSAFAAPPAIGGTTAAAGTFTQVNIGVGTGAASLFLNGAITSNRALRFQTGGTARWMLFTDTTAESGANAGSDLNIFNYDDSGTVITTPLKITRSSGLATFSSGVSVANGLTVTGTVSGSGFSNYLASPPAIGGTTAAAGTFTTLALKAPSTVTGTSYTVLTADSALVLNPSGTFTITLLSASSNSGRILRLKLIAAQAVNSASSNVVPLTSATAGTAILSASAGKWATLQSDGTNWIMMEGN